MPKAVVCVSDCSFSGSQVFVSYALTTDGGIQLGSSVIIDFARSTAQMTNDIKEKARRDIIDLGGPVMNNNDVVLFGAPA